jgi:hypothetical protein
MKSLNILVIFFCSFLILSCETGGCIDPQAGNFDGEASEDDGSCTYARDALLGNYYYSSSCHNIDTFIIIPTTMTAGVEMDQLILHNMEYNPNLDFELTLVNDSVLLDQVLGDTLYKGGGVVEAPGNYISFWYEKCLVGSNPCEGDECALIISR